MIRREAYKRYYRIFYFISCRPSFCAIVRKHSCHNVQSYKSVETAAREDEGDQSAGELALPLSVAGKTLMLWYVTCTAYHTMSYYCCNNYRQLPNCVFFSLFFCRFVTSPFLSFVHTPSLNHFLTEPALYDWGPQALNAAGPKSSCCGVQQLVHITSALDMGDEAASVNVGGVHVWLLVHSVPARWILDYSNCCHRNSGVCVC